MDCRERLAAPSWHNKVVYIGFLMTDRQTTLLRLFGGSAREIDIKKIERA